MPSIKERRVPKPERTTPVKEDGLDWEGARLLLEVARTGSFRSAAVVVKQSVNALRRRLARLEANLGTTLLTRHVDGVRLTPEGERVLAAARRMEAATFELIRGINRLGSAAAGEIKLAATEGLGSFWIAPNIGEFRRRNPNQTVNLQFGMPTVDVLRLEADIAIQLVRPQAKDLKIVKLGRMHVMPFAAKSYIESFGVPKSIADLSGHQVVYQIADQVTPPEEYVADIRAAVEKGHAVIRTNGSMAHFMAVLSGAGIGMLPTYVQVVGSAALVPLDFNYRSHHDIWLVYHPDAARLERVQRMIAWLMEMFSPRKYPWFGDRFIHPGDLPAMAGWNSTIHIAPAEAPTRRVAKPGQRL